MKLNSNNFSISLKIITLLIILLPILPIQSTKAEVTWDYVILGSSIGTWEWPEYYGEYIENDLGVNVKLHNYSVNFQSVSGLLNYLRNNEKLRDDIRNAEVITIGVGFRDMQLAIPIYGAGGKNQPQQIEMGLKTFREAYDAMLTEILSLRSPDTIIRVMDFYCPYVQNHKDLGIYENTKRYWMKFNKCITQVAKKHNIPVAQVFQEMNGPHGDYDPNEKSYLHRDGKHLNDEGYKVVAKLFRELGYT